MKLPMLCLFVLSIQLCLGQHDDLKYRPLGLGEAPKAKLEEELAYLNSIDLDTLDKKLYWIYYLSRSNVHLFLEKDSAAEYFNLAYQFGIHGTCNIITSHQIVVETRIKQGDIDPNYRWLLPNLPQATQDTFLARCKALGYPKNIKRTADTSQLEKRIMTNDQTYRVKDTINWEKQNALDKLNRDILDSLYSAHQTLAIFTKFELDAFSFVLHHSNDCDWNKKWFDIWFRELRTNQLNGGMLFGDALHRMYNSKDGVCWTRDRVDAKVYLDYLKETYPKLFEKYKK